MKFPRISYSCFKAVDKPISVFKAYFPGISPCKMTCNILVLFSNDAETVAMKLVNRFDNTAINTICLSNEASSQRLSNIRQETKVKIHVIFFSPEFLSFLEKSPQDAYYICGQLDTKSTLAVFCLGSKESDVLCYHMAPLKSFISWKKFEIKNAATEGSMFPQELLKRIQEVIAEDVNRIVDIVVLPQFLKRHNRSIYVIFSSPIEDVKDVTVHLNDQREIDIHPEQTNPYALKFFVPDYLFLFSHNVTVRVESKGHIITKQVIHLSQDAPKQMNDASGNCARPTTQEAIYLDGQLKCLINPSGLAPDEEDTITPLQSETNITKAEKSEARDKKLSSDLKELCMQYGLEELSFLISDPPVFSREFSLRESHPRLRKHSDPDIRLRKDSLYMSMCLLPEMDSSHRTNSFLTEKSDHPRQFAIRRSLSLPSTLLSTSDDRDSYGLYMDMGGGESTADDQEIDIRAILRKGLSDSQQELLVLMHNVKEGVCSLSNVEQQFQLWRERYCSSQGETKRSGKTSTFVLPWKEKHSKVTNINESKIKEEQVSARRISDTRASSARSKGSERISIIISSEDKEKSCNELKYDDFGITNTGWVSTDSPISKRNYCPLFLPPLPSRPPPSPKISQIMKPVPSTHKKLPPDAKKEAPQAKTTEKEKSLHLTTDLGEATQEEGTKGTIVELCQSVGLITLGESFVSGLCPFQPQTILDQNACKGEYDEVFETNDSKGYEMPTNINLRNRDERLAVRSIPRPISLPPYLSQNLESPGVAVLHRSEHQSGDGQYKQLLSEEGLSKSQLELLDLMHAFSRGDQTISQVEHQLEEWLSRHKGKCPANFVLGQNIPEKCKKRKQAAHCLPGLKNLILRKPRKTSSSGSKSEDGRDQSEVFETKDSDGHGMSTNINLRNRVEMLAVRSIPRPISLPPYLSQNLEFPGDAVLHRSGKISFSYEQIRK
ncbi:DBB domain-containing protein [Nephila pilipes]|uniref:DBB domain-containing protein n=1 Tax=Nephila pilipes TaxID=299642 RepID=A0A8X6NQY3_NEPPI|nr:DBB domain-containing protein [Nephila pilipes]